MADQKLVYETKKDPTFENVIKKDPDFYEATLSNESDPEELKLYLLCESSIGDFIRNWDKDLRAEFRNIIGTPKVEIKQVHPQATNNPTGNLGVFIRFFVKKCIFNVQNADASSYCIDTFASIFPFKVSKIVPATRLPVSELFDGKFYSTIAMFMVHHFGDKSDLANDVVDLFLNNIYNFKQKHFDESAMHRLKSVVDSTKDPDSSSIASTHVVDYLEQFPRLSNLGVVRYMQLRQMYNHLCASFELADLGDQHSREIQKLPEINCYQLFQLLDPDFYTGERDKYINWFKKYLFFFVYALDSPDKHPVFFIDDPLYECLKYYTEYRRSREPPENLKLCLWMVTLVQRRAQRLDLQISGVDDEHLLHIRKYVENFPAIKSSVVDYGLPTSLLYLGIPIVTDDTVFGVCYSKKRKSHLHNFHRGIIRALMCPFNVERAVIYNPYLGVEASMMVPPVKKEVLEFIRRYNEYDPAHPKPVEYIFTKDLEYFFVKDTIQWEDKCPRKSQSIPVLDYREILDDA